ncbi:MAG: chemotaxis-specific protein-glutamate methyltransferase CheB [Gemmatimonadales bacterium]|nr:chemotaxis-specific protein-glutamate methyltransferase CheB [Gemmatimonadales bacterium]
MIRVLVVDDSVLLRQMVQQVVDAQVGMRVVGSAADGALGLQRLEATRPDVVLLDLDMPEVSGYEVLERARARGCDARFLVFSGRLETGGPEVVACLNLGAADVVAKRHSGQRMTDALAWMERELVPRIRALGGAAPATGATRAPAAAATPPAARPAASRPPLAPRLSLPAVASRPPAPAIGLPPLASEPVRLLVVGASTGGPAAVETFLEGLPDDFPAPILVVQHMPAEFTRHFAAALDRRLRFTVREAADGSTARAGQVWIAPGDHHLTVGGTRQAPVLRLDQGPPEHSCRPAVDPLFRSAAALFGGSAVGVVLTGMGHDGGAGAVALRQAGATVLAQDEGSSVVWGMPASVVQAGVAALQAPPDLLAAEVARLVQRRGSIRASA